MAKAHVDSPMRLRLRRFRRFKRGYYSFVILVALYALSFCLPFLASNRAILVRYEGDYYFPSCRSYVNETLGLGSERIHLASVFSQVEADGLPVLGETDYRALQQQFEEEQSSNFVVMPPMPYGAYESFFELQGHPPHSPSAEHWFGTDNSDRDIFVRLAYGFRISISFALMVTVIAYTFGILAGATLGYFGGWTDMIGLRLVEIWGAIPFLYTIIILSSLFTPSFMLLGGILAAFGWMGITYYIRGEFYRERGKDYVAAAIATGEGNRSIMLRQILPNALTPVITYVPFAVVSTIAALVSLDFLGYGLPAPTPSWGELLGQAKDAYKNWHLVVFPLGALFITLQLVVFIGEAIREAFDPKVFSRLR